MPGKLVVPSNGNEDTAQRKKQIKSEVIETKDAISYR